MKSLLRIWKSPECNLWLALRAGPRCEVAHRRPAEEKSPSGSIVTKPGPGDEERHRAVMGGWQSRPLGRSKAGQSWRVKPELHGR